MYKLKVMPITNITTVAINLQQVKLQKISKIKKLTAYGGPAILTYWTYRSGTRNIGEEERSRQPVITVNKLSVGEEVYFCSYAKHRFHLR